MLYMKDSMIASDTFTAAKNSFSLSSHVGAACPVGSVALFGSEIKFDAHCQLFEMIRPLFAAVFMALWSLVAVRIVLSA